MDINTALPAHPTSIGFHALTAADVTRLSVKQIVNPQLFDNLNRPNAGGLYDLHLGPFEKRDVLAMLRSLSSRRNPADKKIRMTGALLASSATLLALDTLVTSTYRSRSIIRSS